MRRRLAAIIALALIAAAAGAQSSPPVAAVARPEEELLLLQLVLDDLVLADAIPVYQTDEDLLLPLGELARYLSLAIAVRPDEGIAEGFVIEETRRFLLDLARGEVIVGETRFRIPPGAAEVHRDEIYVTSRAAGEWLPVSFEANLYSQSLIVRAREPLPIQARRERLSRATSSADFDPSRSPWPRAPQPYSLFGAPAIEGVLALNSSDDGRGIGPVTTTQYSLRAVGEAGYQEYEAYLSGSDEHAEISRLTVGRRDPRGTLLGPLRATEAFAGTVWNGGSDLLFAPDFGEGILVSSYPVRQQSRFDRRSFVGILEPGWDVELYRNGVLFGSRRSRPDGRYAFEDVPLLYGLNVFRFVFYGPQGQRREEVQRVNVGQGLIPRGETWWRALALDADAGARLALVELDRGVSSRLSLTGAVAWSDATGDGTTIVKGGLTTFFSAVAVNALAAADSAGGAAGLVTAHGRFANAGFVLQHAVLRDYAGQLADASIADAEERTLVRLDGGWSLRRFAVPWSAEIARNVLPSGTDFWQARARAGTIWRSSAFLLETDGSRTGAVDSVTTRLLYTQRLGERWAARSLLQFLNLPDSRLDSGEVILERRSVSGLYLHATVRHLAAADTNVFAAGIGRTEGRFGATATATFDDRSGWSAAANLHVSALWDDRREEFLFSSRALASFGSVSALVFVDHNGNGTRDPGEPPVEGVDLFVNRAARNVPTAADGIAIIGMLPAYQEVELTVSESTIPDPFLRPANAGVRVTPRPGRVERISFALVASGELTGTLFLRDEGAASGYGGIRLQAVRDDGSVAGEVITSFDGYYEILSLQPGAYAVRIAPDQARLLRLRQLFPVRIEIERGATTTADVILAKE